MSVSWSPWSCFAFCNWLNDHQRQDLSLTVPYECLYCQAMQLVFLFYHCLLNTYKICTKQDCFTGEETEKDTYPRNPASQLFKNFLQKMGEPSWNPSFILYTEKLEFWSHMSKTSWAKQTVLHPSSVVLSVSLLAWNQQGNTLQILLALHVMQLLGVNTVQQKWGCWGK